MKALRYCIAVFCALCIGAFALYISGGRIINYVDVPSMAVTAGLSAIMLRSHWKFREMGRAFKAALSENAERRELELAGLFFTSMRKFLYIAALVGIFLGLIAMFRAFKEAERFLPNLGVCIIVMFYAVILDLLVALPLGGAAKKRLAALG